MSNMNKSNPLTTGTKDSTNGKKTIKDYLNTVENAYMTSRSPVSYIAADQPRLVMRNFNTSNFRSDN
jgi:hypothetical protein